jgi:hypothetical protein
MGKHMLARVICGLAGSLLLSACVDSQRLRSNLGGPAAGSAQEAKKQTLASRVLGAIALERVTKRKPDPARLNELRSW